jgi:hypothetical protein
LVERLVLRVILPEPVQEVPDDSTVFLGELGSPVAASGYRTLRAPPLSIATAAVGGLVRKLDPKAMEEIGWQ